MATKKGKFKMIKNFDRSENKEAFEAFDLYKETISVLKNIDVATGRLASYKTTPNSSLDYQIKDYVINSTQKI